MKYSMVRAVGALLFGAAVLCGGSSSHAGWGLLGGSGGGSNGGGSSGYMAGYGASTGGYGASTGGYGASTGGYGASTGGYGASTGGSNGGSSGYAAAYGSSGGNAGSSGQPGILQRVAGRLHTAIENKHARHAARRAAHGSSGGFGSSGGGYAAAYGSSGGYGSNGAGYGSTGTSYGSTGSGFGSTGSGFGSTGGGFGSTGGGYGSTGATYNSANSIYYGASNKVDRAAASLVSNVATQDDAVYLTVTVPASAKVFVNGNETSSTGAVRQFVSRGLKPGKNYNFEIRAEVTDTRGDVLKEEKTVSVTAGQREQLQFAFADSDSTLETSITLNLPEGAKVLLAGKATKATGSERTFRTQHLKPGQIWDDYHVEVQLGDEIKQQTVRLIAGDHLQLNFNFDDESAGKIASK